MARVARLHALVRGRVQGVGFRWFVQEQASALALAGWVRNLRDGSVELEAEGPRGDLETLVERLREGPGGGDVEGVDASWFEPSATYTGFEIRATR